MRLNDVTFLVCSLGLGLLDAFLVVNLVRRITPEKFKQLPRVITITTLIFWAVLWTAVLWLAWDWFYGFIFPPWLRMAAPALGLVYAAVGLLIWKISTWSRSPAIAFCLLGGLEGIISHTWAILGLDLLHKVPLLETSTALPVLIFAFFEKVLYWSFILVISGTIANKLDRNRVVTQSHF